MPSSVLCLLGPLVSVQVDRAARIVTNYAYATYGRPAQVCHARTTGTGGKPPGRTVGLVRARPIALLVPRQRGSVAPGRFTHQSYSSGLGREPGRGARRPDRRPGF